MTPAWNGIEATPATTAISTATTIMRGHLSAFVYPACLLMEYTNDQHSKMAAMPLPKAATRAAATKMKTDRSQGRPLHSFEPISLLANCAPNPVISMMAEKAKSQMSIWSTGLLTTLVKTAATPPVST